jgi:hypothetical protein
LTKIIINDYTAKNTPLSSIAKGVEVTI